MLLCLLPFTSKALFFFIELHFGSAKIRISNQIQKKGKLASTTTFVKTFLLPEKVCVEFQLFTFYLQSNESIEIVFGKSILFNEVLYELFIYLFIDIVGLLYYEK
jgi:hypothetical protein